LEDAQGQQIYLDTHTLEDAWASPTRTEIQQALDAGIEHPSCQACWDDEHVSKQSRRMHFNKLFETIEIRLDQPQLLDLKMGNTCNMRCRTCNPEVSSQWYREDWLLNAEPKEKVTYPEYLKRWRRITDSYSDDNRDLWNTLAQWLPNTLYIDYYGAEPMLIKKNFEVMENAVKLGSAKDITVHINTNGTIWSDYYEQLLSNFKHVYIDLSIDDIKERCGYIRYSSNWELVRNNLEEFLNV
jgi:sulfatase maturation enzyme AslB (radical SAM superfamily)